MKRREFLSLAGAAAAFPHVALAQQAPKMPHVAWLSLPLSAPYLQALPQGLAEIGYVDGKTIILDLNTPATNAELQAYVPKLIAASPSVIVTYGTFASQMVRAATPTIPIVFVSVADPVGAGLVSNLVRPGSNITGTTILGPNLIGKQVAMLKELLPNLRRFAVPVFPADPVTPLYTPQVQSAAKALGIEPVFIDFVDGDDIARQFDRVFAADVQGAFGLPYNELNNYRDLMFDLYLKNKLPLLYGSLVAPGATTPTPGVVTYAADGIGMIRGRAAAIVDAILKGVKPADIPVEQPTVFDLVVNLDMAKKIGVTIPTSILAQATQVIDYDIRAPKRAN